MTKFLGLSTLCLGLLLVGCGAPSREDNAEGGLVVGVVFDKGGRGDKSFNDSADAGIERAKAELGITARVIESRSDSDYESNLRELAQAGVDMVVAVGLGMDRALANVAPDYPDTKFVIVDGETPGDNVRMLKFREEEGSFLAGYLAGMMSETGKIGFVGGMEIPLIKKFEVGYHAGAKMARPDIEFLAPRYTGSWDDVARGKAAAEVLYGAGADIVFHAAGRCGLGVIRAAADQGKFAIGVDSDQDDLEPGFVLTSMIKRVDEAVFRTIQDLKEGRFTSGERVYSVADDGVGLSEFRFTRDKIGEERLARLAEVRTQIAQGTLSVPSDAAGLQRFLANLNSN